MTISPQNTPGPSRVVDRDGALCVLAGLALTHAGIANIRNSNGFGPDVARFFRNHPKPLQPQPKNPLTQAVLEELQLAVRNQMESYLQRGTPGRNPLLPQSSGGDRISAEDGQGNNTPRHRQDSVSEGDDCNSCQHNATAPPVREGGSEQPNSPHVSVGSSWTEVSGLPSNNPNPRCTGRESDSSSQMQRDFVSIVNAAPLHQKEPHRSSPHHQEDTKAYFDEEQKSAELLTVHSDNPDIPSVAVHLHLNSEPEANNLQALQGIAQIVLGAFSLYCGIKKTVEKK